MKNKTTIITLIVLLSIIAIALIGFMITMLNGSFKFTKFNFGHTISDELVIDEEYDVNFNNINVRGTASDIYIREAASDKTRVVIYGDKELTKVSTENEELNIKLSTKNCIGFCFNNKIARIEVYLPKDYANHIKISNDYGDIKIEEFSQANIDIEEDCGDVEIEAANEVDIKNNYGDITIGKVNIAKIEEDCGDVKVDEVLSLDIENSYGDIEVEKVGEHLKAVNDCGDITIDNVELSKDSYIESNLGDVEIGSTNEIYIDVKVDLGDIKINSNYNKSDIVLKIENDCGDITVNN